MTHAASLLSLLRLPGVGPMGLRKICARLFQMGVPVERLLELTDEQLQAHLKLNDEQVQGLRHPLSDPETDLSYCEGLGVQILLPSDLHYPFRALTILGPKAPPLLFAKGNLELLKLPALGISGSRKAQESSLAAVSALSRMIASQDWVIVSGGAPGTDEAAHLACMGEGPGTIIVLPTGILKPKLRQEFQRHLEIGKTLILSEFPPEQGWAVGCAMQRNQLLVALVQVMVLVEPGLTGGTGGTGRIAQRLGVPRFILDVNGNLGTGAEGFLKEGAQPLDLNGIKLSDLISQFQCVAEQAERTRSASATSSLFTL